MRRIVFAAAIFSVCLWLGGCSGKTEKTDDGKSNGTEKSQAEKSKPDAFADPERAKQLRELMQDVGRAAATADLGGGERIGRLTEAVSETKVAKDLEGSKRLGAFMRAVGLSPAKKQPPDATKDTPSETETLQGQQPKPNLQQGLGSELE